MRRFTETSKWDDEDFLSLPPIHKLVFLFMYDKCDNAGFFTVSPTLHPMLLGITKDEYLGAIEGLMRGCLGANEKSGSKKVFILDFLHNQRNIPLNPKNNAHRQIVELIRSNSKEFDLNTITGHLGAIEGLTSPTGIVKVKVEVEEGGEGGNRNSNLVSRVIDVLNEVTDSNFRHSTKSNVKFIQARINEGYTFEDFKEVIVHKNAQWKDDPKMRSYLRPETLFGSKFESYLQETKKNVSSDPEIKYQKLKARGFKNLSKEDIIWVFNYQHRTPSSYSDYPKDELIGERGEYYTQEEIERLF